MQELIPGWPMAGIIPVYTHNIEIFLGKYEHVVTFAFPQYTHLKEQFTPK